MYSYSNSNMIGTGIIYIVVGLIGCIVFGFITKHINESKGYTGGFAWGFWLNVIGIIVVACKPDNRSYSASNLSPYQQSVREQKYTAQATKEIQKQEKEKATDSSIELIKQLAELHSKGILTDEEFIAKKTSLLEKVGTNQSSDSHEEVVTSDEKYRSNGWINDDDKEFVRCPRCNKRMCIDFIKARKKCPDCGCEY